MRVSALLGATALIALGAGTAQAGNINGWYLGVEGGATWLNGNDGVLLSTVFAPATPTEFDFDTGWAFVATAGYSFGSWRVEGEFGSRSNDIHTIRIGTPLVSTVRVGNDLQQTTLMANALYDIQLSDRFNISIGAGIGADLINFDDRVAIVDSEWSFAYQGIVGLSYAVSRSMDVTLNYRYLVADGADFSTSDPLFAPLTFSTDDFNNNSV